MKSYILVFVIVLLLVPSCVGNQIATIHKPALTPSPIPLVNPTAAVMAVPTVKPVSFVDSAQRLGNGRSWDVALGDLDSDGDLDAFVANGIRGAVGSAVWLNDGQGVFSSREQDLGYGMGLDLGDLDGDGDLDVFIVAWEDVGRVWLNDGTGLFDTSGQSLGDVGGWDVVLGDLDGDNDLDAFIAHEKADTVWLNDGNGIFIDSGQSLGTTYTAAAGLGDVEGDGDLDVVTVGWNEPGKVWYNDGAGNFIGSEQTLTPGYIHIHGMAFGDVTGNGLPDAIMAGSPNQVWLNDGTGAFYDSQQGLSLSPGDTAALSDLDGDDDLDLYLAVGSAGTSEDALWFNDGQGHFIASDLSLGLGFSSGVGLGDLDGDGDLDAFVTHGELGLDTGGGMPNEIWLNEMR